MKKFLYNIKFYIQNTIKKINKIVLNMLLFISGILFYLCVYCDFCINQEQLTYVHFCFLITGTLILYFYKNGIKNIRFLLQNIEKIKKGDWELSLRANNLAETVKNNKNNDNKNLCITFDEISEIHQKEIQCSKLKLYLYEIDNKLRIIYSFAFNNRDYQSIKETDGIFIFEELRNEQILTQEFCSLLYEFCVVSNRFLSNINDIASINSLTLNDLILVGGDLVRRLETLEIQICKQINQI